MIIRHDSTPDTYNPLPITDEALRCLQEAFRDHAPHLELDLGDTDTGLPFVSVTVPGADFDEAPPCITRNERGWQMVRGGDGPLYEFASEREVAEFLGSGGRGRADGLTTGGKRARRSRTQLDQKRD
jgi:hypothetical protein